MWPTTETQRLELRVSELSVTVAALQKDVSRLQTDNKYQRPAQAASASTKSRR